MDSEKYEFEAASVLVANCREIIPPFLRLRDGISFEDGVLDVVILNADGLRETITVLWQLFIRSVGDDKRVFGVWRRPTQSGLCL